MADKTYKLTFNMSDGTKQEVQFVAPQGEKGETGATGTKGDKGDKGATGATGATGVGITEITIAEV